MVATVAGEAERLVDKVKARDWFATVDGGLAMVMGTVQPKVCFVRMEGIVRREAILKRRDGCLFLMRLVSEWRSPKYWI